MFDDMAMKGIFFDYNSQSKGYRIYSREYENIIISWDVTINEELLLNWNRKSEERQNKIGISSINEPVLHYQLNIKSNT